VGRKIHVARLLQVDRIIGVYQKTEFWGLQFSKKNSKFYSSKEICFNTFGSTGSTYFEVVGQV